MAGRRHALFNADGRCRRLKRKIRNSLPSTFLLMNDETFDETTGPEEGRELLARRLFLQSMGKWSGAAIAAAVFGGAWLAFPPEADAGAWVNRRGGYGGGWINRRGYGGGGWINGGGGGGGWINRRGYGGGGAWVNRW